MAEVQQESPPRKHIACFIHVTPADVPQAVTGPHPTHGGWGKWTLPPWGEAGGISADPKPLSPCESQATEEPPWGEGGQLFPTLSAQVGDLPRSEAREEGEEGAGGFSLG